MVSDIYIFILTAWTGTNNFWNLSYRENTVILVCLHTVFPFLMTMVQVSISSRPTQDLHN